MWRTLNNEASMLCTCSNLVRPLRTFALICGEYGSLASQPPLSIERVGFMGLAIRAAACSLFSSLEQPNPSLAKLTFTIVFFLNSKLFLVRYVWGSSS